MWLVMRNELSGVLFQMAGGYAGFGAVKIVKPSADEFVTDGVQALAVAGDEKFFPGIDQRLHIEYLETAVLPFAFENCTAFSAQPAANRFAVGEGRHQNYPVSVETECFQNQRQVCVYFI